MKLPKFIPEAYKHKSNCIEEIGIKDVK
jgi:hypothetical protein